MAHQTSISAACVHCPGLQGGPIHGFVFDLDGVLVDSRLVMRGAFTESFYRHCDPSLSPPLEEFFRQMGRPLPDILRELGLPAAMSDTFRQISRKNVGAVVVCEGIGELLREIRNLGLPMAVMTGKDRERTVELLKVVGMLDYFEWIVCGDDPFPGKPAPDGLNWIVGKLGAQPREIALIGDSTLDIECAVSADAIPLGAGWGVCSAQELLQAGAQAVFKDAADLKAWMNHHAVAVESAYP
jgi:AHBA synthesis associated protein